jgi:hypothetical protein
MVRMYSNVKNEERIWAGGMFLAKHRMKHKRVLVCGVELYGYSERNFRIRSESRVVIWAGERW